MGKQPALGEGLYYHPKSGIIWVRFQHKNRDYRRSTTERTPRAAAKKAREIRTEVEQGELARIERRKTLEELQLSDIAEMQDRGVSDDYLRTEKSRWAVILAHMPEGITLDELTYDYLRQYEGIRRREGRRGQTINKELKAIKRAWKIAERKGYVSGPREWPKIRGDEPDKKQAGKLWPVPVVQKFLSLLHKDARDEAEFAILTGLRITELKRVRPEWVHPLPRQSIAKGTLRLPAEATKGRKPREIPLSDEAWRIVRRRIKAQRPGDLVFSQRSFNKHRRTVCLSWMKLENIITPRDMRHTFASVLLEQTSDPVAAMRILGHRDLRTTEIYLSTNRDRLAAAAVSVGDVFGGKAGLRGRTTKRPARRKSAK